MKTVTFTGHAVKRMFERSVNESEILEVLELGEVIEEYPDDYPFPSRLLLRVVRGRPLHVVAGFDAKNERCYIITMYVPDPARWDETFKARRL